MAENKETENKETKNIERKLGFFTKVKRSITNVEKYPEMAAEGVPSALKYLVKLMAIFAIIIAVGLVYQLNNTIKNGIDYLQNELPDMTYSNGQLKIDSQEPITIEGENAVVSKVIIDTNTENEEQIDKYVNSIDTDKSGVVILKDKAIVKSSAIASATVYTYTDVLSSITNENIDNVTKQDVIGYLTGNGMYSIYAMFLVMMFVYAFIIYLMSVFVDTLVLAILGNITILFTKLRIKFSAVYNMAVYALTLSVILNAIYIVVNMFTGFEVKYFQIMYTSIAYIYLVAAIFIIKSDFMKKQTELMKIIDVQEQVKEEIKQKEQENKQEEKEKEKNKTTDKKEEKDKDKKEKKDSSKGDNEPTGSEA